MSEMTERVAEAMCIEFGFDWEHEVAMKEHERERGGALDSVPDYWDFISMARAAITAMREPTEAMLEADGGSIARVSWPAMIDAALS